MNEMRNGVGGGGGSGKCTRSKVVGRKNLQSFENVAGFANWVFIFLKSSTVSDFLRNVNLI